MVAEKNIDNGKVERKSTIEDTRWITRYRRGLIWRHRAAADFINVGSKVLDVGCGDGTFLRFIKETKQCKGVGIDISSVAIEKARTNGIEAYVLDIDSSDLWFDDDEFDYCTLLDVLEHLYYPLEVLKKIKRVSKRMIASYVNPCWYRYRLNFLMGRIPTGGAWMDGIHLWHWSIDNFNNLLKRGGWNPIESVSLSGVPLIGHFSPSTSKAIERLRPSLFRWGFAYSCIHS